MQVAEMIRKHPIRCLVMAVLGLAFCFGLILLMRT